MTEVDVCYLRLLQRKKPQQIFLNVRVLELHFVTPCWSSCVIWYLLKWEGDRETNKVHPSSRFFPLDGFATRARLPSKSNDFYCLIILLS